MAKGAMDSSTFQALMDKIHQVHLMSRALSRFYGKQSAVKRENTTMSFFA